MGVVRGGVASMTAAVLLAGCIASPLVEDDLEARIMRHYAATASEEDGRCASPEMASITGREVVGREGPRTRLEVRYTYFDPGVGEVAAWPQVLIAERACTGEAERTFEVVERRTGYEVVEMSGERRAGP